MQAVRCLMRTAHGSRLHGVGLAQSKLVLACGRSHCSRQRYGYGGLRWMFAPVSFEPCCRVSLPRYGRESVVGVTDSNDDKPVLGPGVDERPEHHDRPRMGVPVNDPRQESWPTWGLAHFPRITEGKRHVHGCRLTCLIEMQVQFNQSRVSSFPRSVCGS